MVATKPCTQCAQHLPLESFRINRADKTYGRTARCRACLAAKDRADRGSDRRRAAERARDRSVHRQEYFRGKDHRRRAQMAETAVEVFTEEDLFAAWDDAGWHACYWCDEDITDTDPLHVDHLVPLAGGGSHTLDNLVPAHASCNTSKHAKDPYAFALERHPWLGSRTIC